MAHGIVCKHCGSQEGDHEYRTSYEWASEVATGYTVSLSDCPGYESSESQQEERLNDIDQEKERDKLEAKYRFGKYSSGL